MRWLVTRHPNYHLIHIQKRAFLDRLYELILIMQRIVGLIEFGS